MGSRVLGVDFSGASDAGRAVWLTEARTTGEGMAVTDCYRAAEAFGVDREAALAGLRERATAGFDVVALDFPFSLPAALLEAHCGGTWKGLVDWLAGDGPEDPDRFASVCRSTAREHTGDGTAALRRETDLRRAALCPYGERVKHQTFYGVRDVLGSFVDDPSIDVAPMADPTDADTRVVEVYPAATFGWLGLYREGYKGAGANDGAGRSRRTTNVEGIETCSVDVGEFRDTYESHHDALDSLAAALSGGRALATDPPRLGPRGEGHIYV